MIPADNFLLSDDGTTAAVVFGGVPGWTPIGWEADNRPCVVCKGLGRDIADLVTPCPDCDGTGRHTFDIEAWLCDVYDCAKCIGGVHKRIDTFRVHVIDVLPIVEMSLGDRYPNPAPDRFAYVSRPGALRVVDLREQSDTHSGKAPPAAQPGMWAVLLDVHEEG